METANCELNPNMDGNLISIKRLSRDVRQKAECIRDVQRVSVGCDLHGRIQRGDPGEPGVSDASGRAAGSRQVQPADWPVAKGALRQPELQPVWIHKGDELFGGRNNNVLIHTDYADGLEAQGFLEEVFIHEATHTTLDAHHASSSGWIQAQVNDMDFISTYARDHPMREDLAKSFPMWMALQYREGRISCGGSARAYSRAVWASRRRTISWCSTRAALGSGLPRMPGAFPRASTRCNGLRSGRVGHVVAPIRYCRPPDTRLSSFSPSVINSLSSGRWAWIPGGGWRLRA